MKKQILSILSILTSTSILNAGDSHHYLSLVAGNLDFDQTVYGDVDGYEDGNLQGYSDASIVGLNYTWLKEVSDTSVLLGVSPQILLNEGSFIDGGFANVNFLAGYSFADFKLYANYGVGLNSLSDYTVSAGSNYGLTARYDITNHFSTALTYNVYSMEISDKEDSNPTNKYKVDGVLASLSLKF